MDEIRIEANERFDLVDMNRFKAFIREAFSDIFGDLLGNQFETLGAAEDNQKRPLVARVCRTTKTAVLQLTVWRQWSASGQTYKAAIWDKDGYRIIGPNSAVSKSLTVALEPISDLRYLQIRRVATEGTLETRRFYSDAGKYTQNINTQTIDDWEIQENVDSARENATLATAGWIDIATFRTEGEESSISEVTAVAAPWAQEPMFWDSIGGAGPAIENLGSMLFGLFQIISRMRAGTDGRDALYDPRFDAAFEKEGGIRYAQGATSAIGLRDVYERLTACGDVIAARPDSLAGSVDNLHHYRAAGFVSGGASGHPDTVNRRGFCYSSVEDIASGTNLHAIEKYWSVLPEEYWPTSTLDGYTPYLGNTVSPPYNEWLVQSAASHTSWHSIIDSASAAIRTESLVIPIRVPHLCRIDWVIVNFEQTETMNSSPMEYFIARVFKRAKATGVITQILGGFPWVWDDYDDTWDMTKPSAPGTPGSWLPGIGDFGNFEWVVKPGTGDFIVDNQNYSYWMTIYHGAAAGATSEKETLVIHDTAIYTSIREASHVY